MRWCGETLRKVTLWIHFTAQLPRPRVGTLPSSALLPRRGIWCQRCLGEGPVSPKHPVLSVTLWSLKVNLGCLAVILLSDRGITSNMCKPRFISFGGCGGGRGSYVPEPSYINNRLQWSAWWSAQCFSTTGTSPLVISIFKTIPGPPRLC